MTYSTTLPPGFTTWNELWNSHKLIKGEQYCCLFISINQWENYETKDIKARAYDEIMELSEKAKDWRPDSSINFYSEYRFCKDFMKLTQTNLFK